MLAAFEFCALSSNSGFFGKLRTLPNGMLHFHKAELNQTSNIVVSVALPQFFQQRLLGPFLLRGSKSFLKGKQKKLKLRTSTFSVAEYGA